jgi:acyl-CoA reductase-like NAD-dependent aldehyde dehydrogenase
MSLASETSAPIRHADRFFIGGQWVAPSSDATIKVIDSGTEETYFTVAEAQAADISRAVEAAREAFDNGPWTGLSHAERAGYLRAIGAELAKRGADLGQIWPRQSGVLYSIAQFGGMGAQMTFDAFAGSRSRPSPRPGSSGCSSASRSASSARSSRGTPRWR